MLAAMSLDARVVAWCGAWVALLGALGAACSVDAKRESSPSTDVIDGAMAAPGVPTQSPTMDAAMRTVDAGGHVVVANEGGAPDASRAEPLAPRIPEPIGPCPELISGTAMIAGLRTTIVAGEVGATPGSLVFVWHGILSDASDEISLLPPSVRDDIQAHGGLIIAPEAPVDRQIDDTLALGLWDLSDLSFVDHVVACAVRDHNIDPHRIYAMGCIAGGYMVGALGVHRSSYIAAIAPSAGGLTTDHHALEEPRHAPAAFMMHGPDNDALVLQSSQAASMLRDVLVPAGGFFTECMHDSSVCGPADLMENAWTFLKAHPFGVSPKPYASGLPADFPSYCTIAR